jgi:transcriptional regulator with XRE-family HTH domain
VAGTLTPLNSKGKLPPSRYGHKAAVEQIERMRLMLGLTQQEVALGIQISESSYSQKRRGIDNSFSLEEFGRIADLFAGVTGRPLIGFPFLGPQLQDAVDRKVGGWEPSVPPPPQKE